MAHLRQDRRIAQCAFEGILDSPISSGVVLGGAIQPCDDMQWLFDELIRYHAEPAKVAAALRCSFRIDAHLRP